MADSTLTGQAYGLIRHRLKTCAYLPGESINELKICEETGLGRTPVREALLALRREGLIEVRPRKGTFASAITETQINEMYQLRRLLEPVIAVRYRQQYDKTLLLDYDNRFRQLDQSDEEAYFDLDTAFHQFLIDVMANPALSLFYQKVMFTQYWIGAFNSMQGLARREDYYSEHHAIITALIEEDERQIEQSCNYHIGKSHAASLTAHRIAKRREGEHT